MRFQSVNYFGSKKAPRTLWAHVCPSPELMTLQKKRSKHCQALGIKIESRRFRPNLTLARLNRTSFADLARSLEALYLAQADPFWIDSFQLFSSKLHPNGAVYRVAHNFSQRGFTQ
ncbi:MAG TPA: RNA 2',3'-cyclic phosphodiesterase [Gammaproteobacteria bacterium]|nr:MAG: RNA 2',3'-cyclic phosphodiesterase [Candidatus Thioglobus sp. MED-G23]HCL94167.1 RNA 2',3'-cyclic phosphodiesterase [Gammaproteobacteria bacterium]